MLKRFGVVITFRRLLNYSQSLRDSFVGTLSTIFLGDIGFPSTTTSYDEFLDNLSLCCLIWPTFWGFSFSKARPLIFHFLCLNFFFSYFEKKVWQLILPLPNIASFGWLKSEICRRYTRCWRYITNSLMSFIFDFWVTGFILSL